MVSDIGSCVKQDRIVRYPVSWGSGLHCAMIVWVVAFTFPLVFAVAIPHSRLVPRAMVNMFFGICACTFLVLLVVMLATPWEVVHDPVARTTSVRVSPFRVCGYSVPWGNIHTVRRVYWRELIRIPFVGWPTDCTRSVLIDRIGQWPVVVSLQDPDRFVDGYMRV
jgi:hypothetical protein